MQKTLVVLGIVVLLSILPSINSQPIVPVTGYIHTINGKPVRALIIAFDVINIEIEHTFTTNGHFNIGLRRGHIYNLYIIPLSKGHKRISYVPAYVKIGKIKEQSKIMINATVYPASYVLINGEILYIGGKWYGGYIAQVLNTKGKHINLDCGITHVLYSNGSETNLRIVQINEYGSLSRETFPLVYAIKQGVLSNAALNDSLVIVPSNTNVIVTVSTEILDTRNWYLKEYNFTLGTPLSPLNLLPGKLVYLDLTSKSVARLFSLVDNDIKGTELLIEKYERMGFYLAPERDELEKAHSWVEDARNIFEKNGSILRVYDLLERASTLARVTIVKRLQFMRVVAVEGASFLPYFLAIFAASIGFYFFENDKKKFYLFSVSFIIFLIIFYASYPGFTILWNNNKELFSINVVLSFLLVVFFIFYLPKRFSEARLPSLVKSGSLVSTTFSIAKRYSRLKKTRTFITVFSLAALIWAFTVLASISTVYGLVAVGYTPSTGAKGILIKHIVNETISPLSYFTDFETLKYTPNVTFVIPRVFNDPSRTDLKIVIKANGREKAIKSILGLSKLEDYATKISKSIVKGSWDNIDKGVIIPQSLANYLSVNLNDNITIVLYLKGLAIPEEHVFKVVGIFSEKAFDSIKDIDGSSIKPYVISKGKVVLVNSTDIIIMNWEIPLKEFLVGRGTAFSQVFDIFSIYVSAKGNYLYNIASDFIERKAENYYVWIAENGKGTKLFFGKKVENVFSKNISFLVPIVIVLANVAISMYSIVNERRREIFVFNAIGFNPMQIASLFLAESIVYGLLGGGIGYIAGLVTFRTLAFSAATQNIMVREKLEWYWSIITIVISMLVSMIAAFKPAINAAMLYTPSRVRKLKIEEKKKIKREERIFKVYTGKSYGLGIKVEEYESPIFFAYLHNKLEDLTRGLIEKAENVKELEEEELPDGRRVKRFKFKYNFVVDSKRFRTDNEIVCTKMPKEKYYTLELVSKPLEKEEVSLQYLDRVAETILAIIDEWKRERKYLLSGRR